MYFQCRGYSIEIKGVGESRFTRIIHRYQCTIRHQDWYPKQVLIE